MPRNVSGWQREHEAPFTRPFPDARSSMTERQHTVCSQAGLSVREQPAFYWTPQRRPGLCLSISASEPAPAPRLSLTPATATCAPKHPPKRKHTAQGTSELGAPSLSRSGSGSAPPLPLALPLPAAPLGPGPISPSAQGRAGGLSETMDWCSLPQGCRTVPRGRPHFPPLDTRLLSPCAQPCGGGV